jgi:glucosamine--fructose-6-phosphate aminotransferase (isomerizing)
MCGIVGYIGRKNNAIEVALKGLEQLEYRGYDSAGICAISGSRKNPVLCLKKTVGKVINLKNAMSGSESGCYCAIAHTRWATHGVPSEANAHPHFDCSKRIFVVHNGIIENYAYLKEVLLREGHRFSSETDTEVLAHLIERHIDKAKTAEDAVIDALNYIKGTFAIAVIFLKEPDKIIAARRSSPLIIGLSGGEYFLASDASALTEYTKKVVYLDDDEVAVLTPGNFSFYDLKKKSRNKSVDTIDWDCEQAKKEGFPHFMLKEIHRQPDSITDTLRGRILDDEGAAKLGGLDVIGKRTKSIKRVVITACGTAYYAGMVGKYLFEDIAGLPAEVELASELRYRKNPFNKTDALLTVSQSGETADTLAALRLAKEKGLLTLGIVNSVGSSIARETEAGVYNHIGPEIGVASTKAFTSQLAVLFLYALYFGRERNLSKDEAKEIIRGIRLIPYQARGILKKEKEIIRLAKKYSRFNNFLYLGRNYNYPIALEGALKLKEVSYIHAEGYAAGEMKHGPLAMIDENFPTIVIMGSRDSETYEKVFSNIQEIKARGGPVIVIAEEGDKAVAKAADDVFYVPKNLPQISPATNVIPLQLFAYHMAVLRGYDPDKPRNLAKSVTVE